MLFVPLLTDGKINQVYLYIPLLSVGGFSRQNEQDMVRSVPKIISSAMLDHTF